MYPFLFQFALRLFFLDFDVRFLGTAILLGLCLYIIFYTTNYTIKVHFSQGKISLKNYYEGTEEYREYQQSFNSPPLSKRFDTKKYGEERFKRLAKDTKTKKEVFHKTAVDEARTAIQAEN